MASLLLDQAGPLIFEIPPDAAWPVATEFMVKGKTMVLKTIPRRARHRRSKFFLRLLLSVLSQPSYSFTAVRG